MRPHAAGDQQRTMGTDMTEIRSHCTATCDWDIHQTHVDPEV